MKTSPILLILLTFSLSSCDTGCFIFVRNFQQDPVKINVYKTAFDSDLELFLTIGHEYVHVANYFNGNFKDVYDEFAAYMWQANLFPQGSIHNNLYSEQALKYFVPENNLTLYNNIVKPNYMNYCSWNLPQSIPF